MADEAIAEADDLFADSDEWIAAQVRQLFRALHAEDTKAVEVCLFYLRDFLVKILGAHLKKDPRWDSSGRWLEGLGVATPDVQPPHRLRLRDELTWVTRDQHQWYEEPFEFELELCPRTGAFRRYTFRFGDHRPLAEKGLASCPADRWPAEDEWAFVFQRGHV